MANKFSTSQGNMVRTKSEIDLMRKSGQIAAQALKKAIDSAKIGITLEELDKIAEQEIQNLGGQPSFKTVPGYYWATCLSLNQGVVHGIPNKIPLSEGDILGIDIGAIYEGWYSDCSWSILVSNLKDEERILRYQDKIKFLETGEKALWKAIAQATVGKRIGDIASSMQSTIEDGGYSIVKSLSGHGVGRAYHEEPEVPGFGKAGAGLVLLENMTLAIEAIYTSGSGKVYVEEDGWTITSADQSLAGLFEMTVVVGKNRPEVLTNWRKI